jgi:F0F1-type ATP synthase assembly protein I
MTTGLMVMGSELAGFTILGLVIDFAAGTMPGFTIGLTVLGFIMVFLHLMQYAKSMNRPNGKAP